MHGVNVKPKKSVRYLRRRIYECMSLEEHLKAAVGNLGTLVVAVVNRMAIIGGSNNRQRQIAVPSIEKKILLLFPSL